MKNMFFVVRYTEGVNIMFSSFSTNWMTYIIQNFYDISTILKTVSWYEKGKLIKKGENSTCQTQKEGIFLWMLCVHKSTKL